VTAGRVLVGGAAASKPARLVDPGDALLVQGDPGRWVGRGAEKLRAALVEWDPDVAGIRALDVGASTGGFTDCLLQGGAAEVVALDVGHGQLHERLRNDRRVVVMERTNIRHVEPAGLGRFDAVVADLSFISLTTVMPLLTACLAPGGWMVLLVKPQFEAGRVEASRGRGVIRDPAIWRRVLGEVVDAGTGAGVAVVGAMVSPLRGAEGNTEFLLHLRHGAPGPEDLPALLDGAVAGAVAATGSEAHA